MAAESTGGRLLGELEKIEFGELSVLLQKELALPSRLLGIPVLDGMLATALNLPRSPPAPPAIHTSPLHPSSQARKWHGPVIDITGTSTASGKTHIIYAIAALSTLPTIYNGVPLNGKSSAVIIFDNDGRFDVRRQHTVMKSHILQCHQKAQKALSEEHADTVAQDALKYIHLYRPQSSLAMVEMLKGVSAYLLDIGSHYAADRRLDAILIDGMSSFYWQDRLAGSVPATTPGYQETYQFLVQRLREVSARFGSFIVATNWGLQLVDNTSNSSGDMGTARAGQSVAAGSVSADRAEAPAFRSHLPAAWAKFVDVKLVVERAPADPFRCGISIVEALEGRKDSNRTANVSSFWGWVDARGSGISVQENLRGMKFQYTIGQHGISFND